MENLLREILAELKRHHEYIRLRDVRLDQLSARAMANQLAGLKIAQNMSSSQGLQLTPWPGPEPPKGKVS
jgi:hypothetical protein